MSTNRPRLELNIAVDSRSAVVTLTFVRPGVIDITTDARWLDKAKLFTAVGPALKAVSVGASLPPTRVVGSNVSAMKLAVGVLRGQDAGALTFRRVWAPDTVQVVSSLSVPVDDLSAVIDSGRRRGDLDELAGDRSDSYMTMLNERSYWKLSTTGKVFVAGIAAWLLGRATNLKIRGSKDEIEKLAVALVASKRFQAELTRQGATAQSVVDKLGLRNASVREFERITGIPLPT